MAEKRSLAPSRPDRNLPGSREITSIILCGGRGTRMQSAGMHKVCFEVGGRPAINRAIDVYESCGIRRHVVVVGAIGGQVVETVGPAHPNVTFAFQAEQLGTGHAAKIGVRVLESLDYQGDVLVVAGDKVVEPAAIQRLIETFYRSRADAALLVTRRERWPSAGMVVCRENGEVVASVEPADLRRMRLLAELLDRARTGRPIAPEPFRQRILRELGSERKAQNALGPVWEALAGAEPVTAERLARLIDPAKTQVTVNGEALSPDEYDRRCRVVNLSVYLFRAPALYAGLAGLRRDNAQGEEYLTDAIGVLAGQREPNGAPRFRLVPVEIDDPNHVLAFNNPEELLVIEDYLRRRGEAPAEAPVIAKDRRALKPLSQWLATFARPTPRLKRVLREVYGDDAALLEKKRRTVLRLLKEFRRWFGGDGEVLIARAPGRVNLMGRHIDHEGGSVNVLAMDREILLVAQPRADARVALVNATRGRQASVQFNLAEELAAMDWDTWLSRSATTVGPREGVVTAEWDRLILAALLRLQALFPHTRLFGMNAVVENEIPPAAGLSSSSATVVAAAEAAVALNRLDVSPNEMIDLCGQSEWYAGGASGGSHLAAVKFGRRGSVAHMRFFDFEVIETVPLPDEARVVICGAPESARSQDARRHFHQRRLCYTLGLMFLRDRLPNHAGLIRRLRDVSPEHLGVSLRQVYRALLGVPESLSGRAVIEALAPRHGDEVQSAVGALAPETAYPLRGVLLFGLAECERSRRCAGLLRAGELTAVGHLMRTSHDGDRVVRHDAAGSPAPFAPPLDDEYLKDLVLDLTSEDPDRVRRAQLYLQSGAYGCSTPDLDRLVDLALETEGVYGAQMAGAGLGGCVMVLCRPEAVPRLTRRLGRDYYRPRGAAPVIHECTPVQGAGVIRL